MTMQSEHPEPVETSDGPQPGPPSGYGRTVAWIATGAVGLVLVVLLLSPGNGGSGTAPAGVPTEAEIAAAVDAAEDANAAGSPAQLGFTLKDMNGVDVSLASFKGKVILLNFWATWCGPCKAEIPALVELQTQYADDLVVLGLSVDDTVEQLRPYAAEYAINYPVLVGNGREDVQEAYGPLWGIPVSVFIGRDGVIHKKHSGIGTKEQFEREIKALL
ncbi:MAG: TlpA family protein disulfide reductase [Acidobacteria bacterium]|nr:TlpA family protein disulfide reductase [Acidobacteriota bacterium]